MCQGEVFFLDTNVFLQCHPLEKLDWSQVTTAADACAYLSPAIHAELDAFKHDGKQRRSRRARELSSRFRTMLNFEDTRTPIREASPRVLFDFLPAQPKLQPWPDDLDPGRSDDRFIAEALCYAALHPEVNPIVLSHDTGVLLKARRHGLRYLAVPETWLLPNEPDEGQRRITEMSERIAKLERARPQVKVSVLDGHGAEVTQVALRATRCRDLTGAEVDRFMSRLTRRFPMERDFKGQEEPPPDPPPQSWGMASEWVRTMNVHRVWYPPSKDQIDAYQQRAYPRWEKRSREVFANLGRTLESGNRVELSFKIENTGRVPAEHVRLMVASLEGSFEVHGPADGEDEDRAGKALVPAPAAPRGKMQSPLQHVVERMDEIRIPALRLAGLHGTNFQISKNYPHDFHWEDCTPQRALLTCEELRHQEGQNHVHVQFVVPRFPERHRGAIEIHLSARNLEEPIRITVPVQLTIVDVDARREAERLLASLGVEP